MNEQIIVIAVMTALLMIDFAVMLSIKHEKSLQKRDYKRIKLLSKLFFAMKQNPARGVL